MGRTNWGPVIGAVVLIGGAVVVWKTGMLNGLFQNAGTGLFGGTLTGQGIAQGRGQIYTDSSGTRQVINTDNPVAGARAGVHANATLGTGITRSSKAKTTTTRGGVKQISSPGFHATGSARAGLGARYTDFHSFNTITLNKLSVR